VVAQEAVPSEPAESTRLVEGMEEGQAVEQPLLRQSEHELKATSGNKDTQRIINQITHGEDFETNKWRCMSRPDQAYYTLSAFAKLDIEIIEARHLIPSITSTFEQYTGDEPDGFVKVYVDDCLKYATKTINNNRCPQWNDKQTFDIVADLSIIRLHVYDSDGQEDSELCDPVGFVEFCVADIPFDEEIDGWLELRFPSNLQDINTARVAEHMETREEELKHAFPTKPPAKKQKDVDVDLADEALYVQSAAKVETGMMARMMKRMKYTAGSSSNIPNSDEQYNGGEIHVKLKLRRVVDDNTALFAKALVPSYMTYASFIREEYLPKLDLQELLDDAMDIKIKIVDDMLFSVFAFFSYILAWRSWLISGLLFVTVASGKFSSMLVYGFFHLWVALVLILLKWESWRNAMATTGLNASLNQDGLEQVAQFNSTDEMHVFLIRMVQADCGTITGWQELVHFAGTVVQGDGQVGVTYDELRQALHDLWFLDFPAGNQLEKGALVRVDDRRRGSIANITKDMVEVNFDEPGFLDPAMSGWYEKKRVALRPYAPAIPRFMVPKSLIGLVTIFQFQVDTTKKALLPVTNEIRAFFIWQRPMYMTLVLLFLVFRSVLSFYAFYDADSWCHFAIEVMTIIRNALCCVLVVVVLFGKARIWKVGRAIGLMAAGKCCDRRQAPANWKFYKAKDEPYFKPKIA